MTSDHLRETPLAGLHRELGARMVPFAGYAMPVQYPAGIKAEHLHCRSAAGLFDVSHMGQATLIGCDGEDPAGALETLVPGAIASLKPGAMRYSLLLSDSGGIRDDLMILRMDEADGRLFLVVNADPREEDFAHIAERLAGRARLVPHEDRALLALQGPRAEAVLETILPGVAGLAFLEGGRFSTGDVACLVTRSGYTGEDGFEISLPAEAAEAFARRLLSHPDVLPIGLGARDSLRLEAGLCLFGHDIDPSTGPVEANLMWVIPKSRRARADFPGAGRILEEFARGPDRLRVGLRPEGRVLAREGTEILTEDGSRLIGIVTSGGYGPSIDGPIAMGYVATDCSAVGRVVSLSIRGRLHPARIADLPFVPHRYKRKG
ncbi:MAG: glycine cleavage system aminomethyltransferase GcvT [Rhodothalassiaceae bacterium]